ncbi:hypothetical protein LCGC14_3019710, partial [marine sediment metagenome]
MKLIRRILPVLLLMWGCTEAPNPPTFTMRHPDMNYLEFLSRAEALVEKNFPEVNKYDIEKNPVAKFFFKKCGLLWGTI